LAYDDKPFPDHGCCLLVFLSFGLWWQTCLL
jgi:hypothetical protein